MTELSLVIWSKQRLRLATIVIAVMFPPTGMLAAESTATSLKFMPEIERILSGNGGLGERIYFSFTNGEVSAERRQENQRLNRILHRDLALDLTPGLEQWTGISLEVASVGEDAWNASVDKLIKDFSDNLAPPLPTMQVTPGLWFFKTGDGQFGLMRIFGFVEPHPGSKGMKIVYKLARASLPIKTVSKDLPLPDRIKQFLAGEPSVTGRALEIWEQKPDGKMALRHDLTQATIPPGTSGSRLNPPLGQIYYLKAANRFYIQWDGLGASTQHYYGPFDGDPAQVLGLQTNN